MEPPYYIYVHLYKFQNTHLFFYLFLLNLLPLFYNGGNTVVHVHICRLLTQNFLSLPWEGTELCLGLRDVAV